MSFLAEDLPPLTDRRQSALAAELSRIPEDLHEDAIQEAWLAHLEGGDPVRAVGRFRDRERAYRKRHVTLPGNM